MSYQPSTSTIIDYCQGIVKSFLQYFSDKCKINADTWETLIPSAHRYTTFILTFLIFGEIWVFMGLFGKGYPHYQPIIILVSSDTLSIVNGGSNVVITSTLLIS